MKVAQATILLYCVITLQTIERNSAATTTTIQGNTVQWIDISSNEAFGLGLEPAGYETERLQYLCRVLHKDRWISGKLFISLQNENRIVCVISDDTNGDIRFYQFQILQAPPGSLSWIPSSGSNLWENAIPAGDFQDNEVAYVCRATYDETPYEYGTAVVPGAYSEKFGKCFFSARKTNK